MGQRRPRLSIRGRSWVYRIAVPEPLRAIIGRREIKESFGPVSLKEAERQAKLKDIEIDLLFSEAEAQLAGKATNGAAISPVRVSDLSDSDILTMVQGYLARLERDAAPVPFSAVEREERLERVREEAIEIAHSPAEDASLQDMAAMVAGNSGIELSGASVVRVADAVKKALLEHLSREEFRLQEMPVRQGDPVFAGVDRDTVSPSPKITFSKAVALYRDAPDRRNLAPKTLKANESHFGVFAELLGADKDIASITKADILAARDVLIRLPPNAKKRFPRLSLQKIAEQAERSGERPLSPKSLSVYFEDLSALFSWLEQQEYVVRNPAKSIGLPKVDEYEEESRRPFSLDELSKLFASSDFSGANGKDWIYWLPRLALFTGARFAELMGLQAEDLHQDGDIWVLEIRRNAIRRLKNKGSERVVPVPEVLLQAGFLDYAKRSRHGDLLFADASGPKHVIQAQNQNMARRIRKVFADEALVFHSFRHTFKDAASRARVPDAMIARIGGWKLDGHRAAMHGYGQDRLIPILKDEIDKVSYPGVVI